MSTKTISFMVSSVKYGRKQHALTAQIKSSIKAPSFKSALKACRVANFNGFLCVGASFLAKVVLPLLNVAQTVQHSVESWKNVSFSFSVIIVGPSQLHK